MKYNLVLIPISKSINASLVGVAESLSLKQGIKPSYLLSNEKSHPHISVFQFETQDDPQDELLRLTWNAAEESWQKILLQQEAEVLCHLHPQINYKNDFEGPFSGITWAEVLVDKVASSEVVRFHNLLLSKLTLHGIQCLNAHAELYTPHFTLFNAETSTLELDNLLTEIPETYTGLRKPVYLAPALGVANDQWELVDILQTLNRNKLFQRTSTMRNLTIVQSTDANEIAKKVLSSGAHFTNGTYAYSADLIVPTTLSGFEYVNSLRKLPMVLAVNSDISMEALGKKDFEPQLVRANKVALPLAKQFPSHDIIVIFYDEETPFNLYQSLAKRGVTATLHKWGYRTEPSAPKIEGAEVFESVYAFPLPNDTKPVCYYDTAISAELKLASRIDNLFANSLLSFVFLMFF